MPRRPSLLNVREHLVHIDKILTYVTTRGHCPLTDHELRKIHIVNRAILKRHESKRQTGNRHDLYIGA